MSFFSSLDLQPDDPILSIPIAFAKDDRQNKVNLGIGAYRDESGKPMVLSSVKKAERLLVDKGGDKEYLPIVGYAPFVQEGLKLIFGEALPKHVAAAHVVGASGALRMAGEVLASTGSVPAIWLSAPTWSNHHLIFSKAGLVVKEYPYYNPATRSLDFEGIIAAIGTMAAGSVMLLQGCCHNPTGLELTMEQWKTISHELKRRGVMPLFDIAYHGFGGGLEEDIAPLRYFVEQGHELIVTYSFSKNFGLYGERVGLLAIVTADAATCEHSLSHIKTAVRGNYSTPPAHGAKVVSTILSDVALRGEWMEELAAMRRRIQGTRKSLHDALQSCHPQNSFSYLNSQKGMFSFSGLSQEQVAALKQKYGVYILANGRINVAGINAKNIDYVATSICSVL